MAHLCDFLREPGWGGAACRVVAVSSGTERTASEFRRGVGQLAASLERLDLPVGRRVGLLGVATVEWLEVFLACACRGWIVALLNDRWSLEEALSAVQNVAPDLLFYDVDTAPLAQRILAKAPMERVFIGENGALKKRGREGDVVLRKPRDDSAVVCFTSGTTGAPKGVVLSHRALCFQAFYKIVLCRYAFEDVYLHTAPLCHVGGLVSALAMTTVGATQFFVKRFRAVEAAQCLQRYAVTCLIAVPAMISDLAALRGGPTVFPSVQKFVIGGGAADSEQAQSVGWLFPNAGVYTAYGMSEAASSVTYEGPIAAKAFGATARSAGFPIPGTEIAIDRSSQPPQLTHVCHESFLAGEVRVRGPHLLTRYWNDSSATATVLDHDGWFRSGDIGEITSNGALVLRGRLKEMIKSGGENIYPVEIEAILRRHPAIREAVVIGVPHPRLGETLCVYLALHPDVGWRKSESDVTSICLERSPRQPSRWVSPEDLFQFCVASGMTRYKLPRIFVAQFQPLPRGSTGKIQRDTIRSFARHLTRRQLRFLHSHRARF